MKCPKCTYNQLVGKYGMKCRGCGYQFTFNPKEYSSARMTDGRFTACINAASQQGVNFFTKNQLYASYCRRQKPSRASSIFSFLFFGGGAAFAIARDFPFWIVGIASAVSLYSLLRAFKPKPDVMSRSKFMKLLDRWITDGKEVPNLITEPTLHNPPPEWNEKDIYDYGVENILIVQRDEYVDLLVLNNAHAEQRMLVISETGYPEYLMPQARKLLNESPDMRVHLLHDADKAGLRMIDRVKRMDLPLEGHEIVDLGVKQEDFKRMKRTEHYDRGNRSRALPVDSMATPFLVTGIAACFAGQTTLGLLLDEHANEAAAAHASSSFG